MVGLCSVIKYEIQPNHGLWFSSGGTATRLTTGAVSIEFVQLATFLLLCYLYIATVGYQD